MSQAEELLNSLYDDGISVYSMGDEPHIVVNSDRTITVPEELRHIAVQFDHNVETVTFDCPRYWDDHDFSNMHVYINYMCSDGYKDQYPVKNLRIDEDDSNIIHFEWTISKNVTFLKGKVSFLVCIKSINENGEEEPHWNSRLNQDLIIDEGMECTEQIIDSNPDVIENLLARMEELETTGGVSDEQIENALNKYLDENPITGTGTVKSVNGVEPDESGNIEITVSNIPGETGGYYMPNVSQTDANTMTVSFTASKDDMPAVSEKTITLPSGQNGNNYVLTESDKQEIAELAAQLVETTQGGNLIITDDGNGNITIESVDSNTIS